MQKKSTSKPLYVWCQFFYPELISTGQVVTDLFEALSKDLKINVLCAQPTIVATKKVPPVLNHKNISIERIWSTRFPKLSLLGKLCNQISFACSLLFRSLFIPKYSQINVFTDPFFLPLILFIIQPIKKFSYTLTLFDIYPDTLVASKILSAHNPLVRLMNWITASVFANASHIITIGRCMEKIVKAKLPPNYSNLHYIPIWCDTRNIQTPSKHYKLPANLSLETSFIVGYSGNLAKYHPIETLIHAAQHLQDYPNIKFLFVGSGSKKQWATNFCNKHGISNCHFLPYVERSQLGSLLSQFDCGLVCLDKAHTGLSVPSKMIGLMSAGVPTIACMSSESDVARIVTDYKFGYVCPPKSHLTLAEQILSLYNNSSIVETFKKNAKHATETTFHIDIIAQQYLQIISQP